MNSSRKSELIYFLLRETGEIKGHFLKDCYGFLRFKIVHATIARISDIDILQAILSNFLPSTTCPHFCHLVTCARLRFYLQWRILSLPQVERLLTDADLPADLPTVVPPSACRKAASICSSVCLRRRAIVGSSFWVKKTTSRAVSSSSRWPTFRVLGQHAHRREGADLWGGLISDSRFSL